jgi:Domain of unknown function (DUF4189)
MTVRVLTVALVVLALLVFALDAAAARAGKRQLWGAIAYNSKTGVYGFIVDQKTKREAESAAFAQCGPDCDLIKTFRDSCGVVAAAGKRVVWETGASHEIAQSKALRKCGGDGCAVKVWACTSEK